MLSESSAVLKSQKQPLDVAVLTPESPFVTVGLGLGFSNLLCLLPIVRLLIFLLLNSFCLWGLWLNGGFGWSGALYMFAQFPL